VPSRHIALSTARAVSQSQDELAADPEALQQRVTLLEKTLAEMEETDRLRDRASAVLKEELTEMRRRENRGNVDVSYIKGVRRASLTHRATHCARGPFIEHPARP